VAIALLGAASSTAAQQPPPPPTPATGAQNTEPLAPIDDTIDAGEAENKAPARRLVSFNEYESPHFTIAAGFGYLYDYVAYRQDENSKEQFDLSSEGKVRDTRILLRGRLKFVRRATTWSLGYMYNADKGTWHFRQTGVMVEVPEIMGHVFVGRTKEGFSLNKVMVGYAGWTNERAPMSDAALPILADGVKWLGYAPKARLVWNLGFYGDALSEGESFSSYENQLSGRLAWLPILSTDGGRLLHVGMSQRYGKVNNGKLRLRARPGAWAAPYFVDTEEFAADSTTMTGLEAYYRPGPFTFGSEFFFERVDAPESGNPLFHGGEVVATWLMTGETRSYNTRGGYFNQVSPRRPVFNGGPGAWEVVAHYSYTDLDSQVLKGGRYWRFTPMLNWYVSDHVRWETIYGYGSLDRFGLVGKTHFFQTRLQLQL
jgi:phosphate-selective porin OprO/OprP